MKLDEMNLGDLKSNSHKSKELTETTQDKAPDRKVIHSEAKFAKKTSLQKIRDAFINEDIENVKSYVFFEVVVPAIKDTIVKTVFNSIEMLMYGEVTDRHGDRRSSRRSYDRMYNRDDRRESRQSRQLSNYNNVIIDTRDEARDVLEAMERHIKKYDVVTVADLYDYLGVTGTGFTDRNYGWTDIRTARIVQVPDGYKLRLPRALPID